MKTEPATKRTVVFVDGQNLFHAAKAAFGCTYPNFDVARLAAAICTQRAWQLKQVRFYTGVPAAADNPSWNHFWIAKLAQMGRDRVHVFSRPLRYRLETVRLRDGSSYSTPVAQEKGIDVRIALDIVGMAWRREYDVAMVFSQDQDLSEVADEIRGIAREQDRWIKIACAFPVSPIVTNRRGINGTDWIPLDRPTYDTCLDPRDYRAKPQAP